MPTTTITARARATPPPRTSVENAASRRAVPHRPQGRDKQDTAETTKKEREKKERELTCAYFFIASGRASPPGTKPLTEAAENSTERQQRTGAAMHLLQISGQPNGICCLHTYNIASVHTSCSGEGTMGETSKGTILSRFLNILHQEGHRSSIGLVVASSPIFFIPWFLFHSLNRRSHSPLGWEGRRF